MFQRMRDDLFQGLPNVFGIADDILIAWFDDMGSDHNATWSKALGICRQASLKLNIDKCLFRCTSKTFFSEVISWSSVSPYPKKVQPLMVMPPPKCKKELQSFLVILSYMSKYLQTSTKVFEPLGKLTSIKNGQEMVCIRVYMVRPGM